MQSQIEISSPEKEGVLQVSKSRKLPLLISSEEMESLLEALEPIYIFDGSRPLIFESMQIPKEEFLRAYKDYILGIKEGELIEEGPLRPYFSAFFTSSAQTVYAQRLVNGKYLIKPRKPCIQLQRHHFIVTNEFLSGVMGKESITWGIQFSYPSLYLDPKTQEIGKVEKNDFFPNTELFGRLAKWVRDNTRPTPFVLNGEKSNQPMRLGKACFEWINNHPNLKQRGLHVITGKNPSSSHRK